VKIDIWSDIACPWCYIGKRRLETALASFPHRDEVEVVWHSFQLDPSAPQAPEITVAQRLSEKYGVSAGDAAAMMSRVEGLAAEEGMTWRHAESLHVNTLDAHRLLHLAKTEGKQDALKEALLSSYFAEAGNVADPDTLVAIATRVGLDEARVREVLSSRAFESEVEADIAQAAAYGASGVPFYVIDERYGISGAQPAEVFTQVLEKAWSDTHLTLVGGAADGACGPDGCAI
jgi:predicted DsbA family dithiol-disulfide isomerase